MKYLKKIISLLAVLIGVSILSFMMANISTIEPAEAIARRAYSNPTQEQIAKIRLEKGLDRPIAVQYIDWFSSSLQGDLGTSYQTNQPVVGEMADKLKATLSLTGAALFWVVIFVVPLSILSATEKNRFWDHLIRGITVLGISIPSFWLGFLLLIAFAISLPIFKVVDYGNINSLILPSITLALPVICSSVRILRATLLKNMKQDYVIYAKSRGLSSSRIMWKHILKNSLPPVVTIFFQNIGMMIAGSAIVETVFSWPGLGSYFVSSIINRDLPVINGCVLVFALIFVLANTVGELTNRMLNPRMISGKELVTIA